MNTPVPQDYSGSTADAALDYEEDEGFNLRSCWLLVLERKWYALTVFLATVLVAAAITLLTTPIYQAFATVQVLKHGPQILRVADVMENTISNDADFNTQIKILESTAIARNVAARLTEEEAKQLTEPFKTRSGDAPGASPERVLNGSVSCFASSSLSRAATLRAIAVLSRILI